MTLIKKLFCLHDWEIIESISPFSNVKIILLSCKKCGKLTKKELSKIETTW